VPAIIQVRLTHKVEGTMLSVVVSLSEVADKRQRKAELG
jgi:dihydroxyacetone kinase-like predicted kinase